MKKQLMACALAAMMLVTAGCDDDEQGACEMPDQKVAGQQIEVHEQFPTFTAKTLDGETVTNQIFSGKKLTVVNMHATFCGPCIAEMPELGEWADEMPNDVQLIGIVCDVQGENDTATINDAKRILRDANAGFVNIIPSADLTAYLSTIEAVPTTIFVNGEGRIVGDPIVGADVDGYKDFVEDYLRD